MTVVFTITNVNYTADLEDPASSSLERLVSVLRDRVSHPYLFSQSSLPVCSFVNNESTGGMTCTLAAEKYLGRVKTLTPVACRLESVRF